MIRFLALLLIAGAGWAAPVIFPSTATVTTGKTIQFTSTDTVTWSLAPGSVGSISGTGLYTAPATIQNKNVFLGCPLVPDSSIYNLDITSLPVAANSSTRISAVGAVNIEFEPYFPANRLTSTNSTASTMTFRYTDTQDGASYSFIDGAYRGVETNLYPDNYFAQDRHIMAVNSETCEVQEIYNLYERGLNPECTDCNAQSGFKYGPVSYRSAHSDGATDAAGMHVMPLLIKYEELKRGEINHALRFTLANGYHAQSFLWPATNFATAVGCTPAASCFSYGSLLRLKSSFSESGFSTEARAIIRALKKHGMYDTDGGLSGNIQTMAGVLADTSTFNALMVEIPASGLDFTDFEHVDASALMVSSATIQVKYPNAYGAYPPNYAVVIATRTSDGLASYRNIAVQGVNAGAANTPWPPTSGTLSVMAGTPQFPIEYWISGSTQTTATCSMSHTVGTLSSDCLYTAPSSVVKFSSAVITITPVADSTAPITMSIVVYSSSGIRVDSGWKSAFITSPVIPYDSAGNYGPDVSGEYWAAHMPGSVMPWYARDDAGYPQSDWRQPQPDDIGLHYTGMHGTSDGGFGAMVPNGTYTLRLLFGREESTSNTVMRIESQNEILMSSNTFVTFISTSAYTAKTATFTVTVDDNTFYFAMRYTDNTKYTLLNGFELELDEPAPEPPASGPVSRPIRGRAILRGRGVFR